MATTTMAAPKKQLTTSNKLGDQAATAALYATNQTTTTSPLLDQNGKLSSASAATSLKYANAKDLPSYPSSGMKDPLSAASAAASLGWANQKTFEHWKPTASSNASTAAVLAADQKSPQPWQPQQSSSGAKAAAMAHKDPRKVDSWKPEASAHGNSAATIAFRNNQTKPQEQPPPSAPRQGSLMAATGAMSGKTQKAVQIEPSADSRHGSMMAATGAMSGKRATRVRSDSMPTRPPTYPDQANAATNALRAATKVHQQSQIRPGSAGAAGASPYVSMNRSMFTSNPPVAPEVEERTKRDSLHASAVAMAKKMYDVQQRQEHDHAAVAASAAHDSVERPASAQDTTQAANQYLSLQDAAQKLAQERLAKLHNEYQLNRGYREYYNEPESVPRSRLSVLGMGRRRAASDSSADDDRKQSQKIRTQMSLFSSSIAQVDEKKRQQDRSSLMAAAQRNVQARMQGMDEKVYQDTGKASPALLNQWEVKAQAAAQANSDTRMEHHGKVNIGGGTYMDQSEIDAVAARNVQPVLDHINEKAEQERTRQAGLLAEKDEKKREAEEKRAREKEEKDNARKTRAEEKEAEKVRKAEEREWEKAKKADEKAARAEQTRMAKEGKKSVKEKDGKRSSLFAGLSLHKRQVSGAEVAGAAVVTTAAAAFATDAHEEHAATAPTDHVEGEHAAEPAETEPTPEAEPTAERAEAAETAHVEPDTTPQRDTGDIREPETEPRTSETAPTQTASTAAETRASAETPATEHTAPIDTVVSNEAAESAPTSPREATSPESPKGDSKVKSWLKNRFSRRQSRAKPEDQKIIGAITASGSDVSLHPRQPAADVEQAADTAETDAVHAAEPAHTEHTDVVDDADEHATHTTENPDHVDESTGHNPGGAPKTEHAPVEAEQVPEVGTVEAPDAPHAEAAEPVPTASKDVNEGVGEEQHAKEDTEAHDDELLPPPKIGSPVGSTTSRGSVRSSRFLEDMRENA